MSGTRHARTVPSGGGDRWILHNRWIRRRDEARSPLRPPLRSASDPSLRQKATADFIGVKVFPCDGLRGARMQRVIATNGPDRFCGLGGSFDGEQALPRWKEVFKAGRLQDHRTPRRQVTRGAIAKPAAARTGIAALDAAELAKRAGDVIPV